MDVNHPAQLTENVVVLDLLVPQQHQAALDAAGSEGGWCLIGCSNPKFVTGSYLPRQP